MTVLLNNVPCLDPAAVARDCGELGIRVDWLGKPNSYRCPDGASPGEAYLLLSLSALRRLDPTGTLPDAYDLEFSIADQSGHTTQAKIPGLTVTDCQCLTPGARGDDAAYLLTLVDRRHLDAKIIADVGFGLKHRFAAHDLTSVETWQGAATLLWGLMDLPGDDTLPITPAANPNDLEYWQTSALFALEDVAGRCGCRLVYDPIDAEYRFVEAGAEDSAFTAALATHRPRQVWDDYSRPPARGRIPRTVRVLFGRLPHVRGLDGSPWHAVDVSDPLPLTRPWSPETPIGTQTLKDDFAALHDAYGALSNGSQCMARAQERAAAYFAELAALVDDQRLIYAGALSDAGLLPGPLVSATVWSDLGTRQIPGRGMITEVVRRGVPLGPGFDPRTIDPLTELVRLTGDQTNGPGASILHDAWVQRWDSFTGTWVDRQRIWLIDAGRG